MSSYYDYIGQKTEMLVELLESYFNVFGFEVREDYEQLIAEYPMITPVLTVGLHSLKTGGSDCAALLGKSRESDLNAFGRTVTATYRITVHSSAEHANTVCRSSAAVISEACIGVFDVVNVTSGLSKYDRQCNCVVMPIDVTLRYLIA